MNRYILLIISAVMVILFVPGCQATEYFSMPYDDVSQSETDIYTALFSNSSSANGSIAYLNDWISSSNDSNAIHYGDTATIIHGIKMHNFTLAKGMLDNYFMIIDLCNSTVMPNSFNISGGFLPSWTTDGCEHTVSGPPRIIDNVWEIYLIDSNKTWLNSTYDPLKSNFYFYINNRNYSDTIRYLNTSHIQAQSESINDEPSGETRRWQTNAAHLYEPIDLNSLMWYYAYTMKRIINETGIHPEDWALWDSWQDHFWDVVENKLWDTSDQMWHDYRVDTGTFSDYRTAFGSYPLYVGLTNISSHISASVSSNFGDRDVFLTACGVPAIAWADALACCDRWNGGVWSSPNYETIIGLANYGFHDVSSEAMLHYFNATNHSTSPTSPEAYHPITCTDVGTASDPQSTQPSVYMGLVIGHLFGVSYDNRSDNRIIVFPHIPLPWDNETLEANITIPGHNELHEVIYAFNGTRIIELSSASHFNVTVTIPLTYTNSTDNYILNLTNSSGSYDVTSATVKVDLDNDGINEAFRVNATISSTIIFTASESSDYNITLDTPTNTSYVSTKPTIQITYPTNASWCAWNINGTNYTVWDNVVDQGWVEDPYINASSTSLFVGTWTWPEVFQLDGHYHMMIGRANPSPDVVNAYTWDGSQWVANTTLNSTFPDLDDNVAPTVFWTNGTLYMIYGFSGGDFRGLNYTDSTWKNMGFYPPSIAGGMYDIGSNTGPEAFNKSGVLYIVSGGGGFQGWNATYPGVPWQNDSVIESKAAAAGFPTNARTSSVFEHNGEWYMLVGGGDDTPAVPGQVYGFRWSGSQWVVDTTINNSIPLQGNGFVVPEVFTMNGNLYMILGGQLGTMGGFNYSDFTRNVEVDAPDGSYHVQVFCNDTNGHMGYADEYFTVDSTAPDIEITSPLNTTYTSAPTINVTTSKNASACLYNLDGGSNSSMQNTSKTEWGASNEPSEGTHQLNVYCNNTLGVMGSNSTMWYTYDLIENNYVVINVFDEVTGNKIFPFNVTVSTDSGDVDYFSLRKGWYTNSTSGPVEVFYGTPWNAPFDHSWLTTSQIRLKTGDTGAYGEISTIGELMLDDENVICQRVPGYADDGSTANSYWTIKATQQNGTLRTATSTYYNDTWPGGSVEECLEFNGNFGGQITNITLTWRLTRSNESDPNMNPYTNIKQLYPYYESNYTYGPNQNKSAMRINVTRMTYDMTRFIVGATNSSYYPRDYYMSVTNLTNVSLNAYLISTGETVVQTTFLLTNIYGIEVPNVTLSVQKYISGSWITVAQKETDSSGLAVFQLISGDEYRVTYTYDGEVYYYTFSAVADTITLTVDTSVSANFTALFDDIYIRVSPLWVSYNVSDPTENVNFNFTIVSTNSTLQGYGMRLVCNGTTNVYESNITGSPAGGSIDYTYNIAACAGNMTMYYYFTKTGYTEWVNSIFYLIVHKFGQGLSYALQLATENIPSQMLMFISIIVLIFVMGGLAIVNTELAGVAGLVVGGIFLIATWFPWELYVVMAVGITVTIFIKRRLI